MQLELAFLVEQPDMSAELAPPDILPTGPALGSVHHPCEWSAVALRETFLLDAIALITKAESLPDATRTQWICSLRQIARALDRPLESLPARWTALRQPVSRLHHLSLGITAKTLANHKANLKAALRWLTGEANLPSRGTPLSRDWQRLSDRITDKGLRARLYGLMRFASARHLGPTEVGDDLLAAYLLYRAETTALSAGLAAQRSIARAWNRCGAEVDGWPKQRLAEPPLGKAQIGPEWESFP